MENKENLSEQEKEEFDEYLTGLISFLIKRKNIVIMTVMILITME